MMKYLLLLLLVAVATSVRVVRIRRSAEDEYKICIAEDLLEICNQMAAQETKSPVKIICVSERDRIECLETVKDRKADFIAAEPEDMLVAAKLPNQDFAVFEEVRTYDEPEGEFRYEGVVLIHKDLKLDSIQDLRGLKSCHTGVGRNVGYKVPLTKLKNMGLIGNLAEPDISPRENELKAFSNFFNKSCIVGKWSLDPEVNKKLKERYSNLCDMCEKPAQCDYPDIYSGYEGVLRCLAHNNGDVGFTKEIFVKKFFGLPIGTIPAKPSNENPDLFAYLCPDGSRLPIRGKPCRWAARPWPGYITNADGVKKVEELRKKLENLYAIGNRINAPWLGKILEMSNLTFPHETKVIAAGDYLDKANYTDVLERDYGPPFKTIKICVLSATELKKCKKLSAAAFSRDIRPRFDCVQEKTHDDCFKAIRDGSADIISVSGNLVLKAQKQYNLKPIVSEIKRDNSATSYYSVAVVKKNSAYKSLADLRGAKSCHPRFGPDNFAGYYVPLYTLIKLGLIKEDNCPYATALSEYFSGGSCIPGAKDPVHKLPQAVADKLCSQCAGQGSSKCTFDYSEPYAGFGAFRCLAEGQGDVAFVWPTTVLGNTDGKNKDAWAAELKSADFELLCPNGERAPVDQFEKCNLAHIPTNMVVTSNSKSEGDVDEIISTLTSVGDLFNRRPEVFKLFGKFENQRDLIFKDSSKGLKAIHKETDLLEEYHNISKTAKKC